MSCLVDYILSEWYGEREEDGPGSNPKILRLINKYQTWVTDDSKYAYCALFMSDAFIHLGAQSYLPEGNPVFLAREFLKVGDPVDNPLPGDLVIFWRGAPDGWKGHVGVYIRRVEDVIYTLGANQSNSFIISPYAASRLLGYRRTVLS